jgi:putative PIN family toxin of toxin-antitoxin system
VVNRIVVDTNVLVSAMLSPEGNNRQVLRACLTRAAEPLVGTTLFHEYIDLLSRPVMEQSPLSASKREALFAAFLSVAEWVKVYFLWRPNLPDEADNHLIELALAGQATTIVTNNVRDVGRGELKFPGLAVRTPAQFLEDIQWQP